MAALVALMGTGLVLSGLYALATNKHTRAKFLGEMKYDPWGLMLALVMLVLGLTFFWAVMIPQLGEIPVSLFGHKLHVWSASGIAFAVMLGLVLIVASRRK